MADDLQKRHMQAWGRAAQIARRCIEMKLQGYDTNDPALQAAREALLAELVTLVDLSQQMDNRGPGWRRGDIYMAGAQAMISACGVSLQEIDVYRGRSVDSDSVGVP